MFSSVECLPTFMQFFAIEKGSRVLVAAKWLSLINGPQYVCKPHISCLHVFQCVTMFMCWRVCCSGYASLSLWATTLHVILGHFVDSSVWHSICYQLKRLPCGEEMIVSEVSQKFGLWDEQCHQECDRDFSCTEYRAEHLSTSRLFDQVLSNI